MFKPDYDYTVHHPDKVVQIIDLNLGNMSVTNGAEYVLTDILKREIGYARRFGKQVDRIKDYTFIYRDSEGQWDTIIPHWDGLECKSVDFIAGVNPKLMTQ